MNEVLALADKAGMWWPMGSSAEALHDRARIAEFARLVQAAERERCAKPTEAMELAGMRALRNTYRTVSGEYSREQARACWYAMMAAMRA